MTVNENLLLQLFKSLPDEVVAFLKSAIAQAACRNWKLYVVGGTVRDLLLGRTGFDLDISVEGDAIELARAIAASTDDVTVHHRFNTARVKWAGRHIDIARSREETYARPGALPTVRPGTIEQDLFRRDFTVNAMAISLNPDDQGRLIDLNGGSSDLRQRLIRIIHPKSFIDDATRIWRSFRYEQRLDFCIDPETLQLLQHDRDMLITITPDRLRYELECILTEPKPEKVFRRADELGLLSTWHKSLKGDTWLSESCAKARSLLERPSPEVYLSLLAWRLTAPQKEEFISTLRFTKSQTRAVRDSAKIIQNLEILSSPAAKPSEVVAILDGLDNDALQAAKFAIESDVVRHNIECYLTQWHRVSPDLTGEDLKTMGVSRGPEIKLILDQIRDLRLDGVISSRAQEESFVTQWLNKAERSI